MVTDASKTQRTVFSFLPVRDGPVLEGAFGFGIFTNLSQNLNITCRVSR